jgi:hypothetical protein
VREAVLAYFPPRTHPLTLVSDPDDVLAEESLVATLAGRGFTLISEPDPVHPSAAEGRGMPPMVG